ncbi:MAG: hypothetical protein OEU80_05685, partial [Deltaproteobacteria bacterium]|nr:hypothetical protein [Deltaproteobacteria bacterium]
QSPRTGRTSWRFGAIDHVAFLDVIVHLENPSQVYKVHTPCWAKPISVSFPMTKGNHKDHEEHKGYKDLKS